jgi:transcriptional regulator with XRE-family HTH domain
MAKKDNVEICGPFALCMKRLRLERKMTQGDIVRATGLERGYVSNLESGKIRHPRMATVARVASAFGMKLSEFFAYLEEQFPEYASSSLPKK